MPSGRCLRWCSRAACRGYSTVQYSVRTCIHRGEEVWGGRTSYKLQRPMGSWLPRWLGRRGLDWACLTATRLHLPVFLELPNLTGVFLPCNPDACAEYMIASGASYSTAQYSISVARHLTLCVCIHVLFHFSHRPAGWLRFVGSATKITGMAEDRNNLSCIYL